MEEVAVSSPPSTYRDEPPKSAGDCSSLGEISALPKVEGLFKGLTPRTVFSTPRSIRSAPASSVEAPQTVTSRCFRPSLVDLCIPVLAANFAKFKSFGNLPSFIKDRVVAELSLDLPLDLCAKLLTDEEYWKRRAILRWQNCDVSAHGRSWKELYFERNTAAALERELTTLKLEYGWRNVRMNYDLEKFGMKLSDCLSLSAALPTTEVLTYLNLSCNLLNDEKVAILVKGLSVNPKVVHLDLSHNNISDLGVANLAKLIASANTVLGCLNINNNNVTMVGARSIAEALNGNGVLSILIASYNKIGDEGGRSIFEALQYNTTLQRLSLASCEVGVETATAFSSLLKNLNSGLTHLDLSAEGCKVLKQFNLQFCGAGQELEASINKHVMTKNAAQLERRLGRFSPSNSQGHSISSLSAASHCVSCLEITEFCARYILSAVCV